MENNSHRKTVAFFLGFLVYLIVPFSRANDIEQLQFNGDSFLIFAGMVLVVTFLLSRFEKTWDLSSSFLWGFLIATISSFVYAMVMSGIYG